MQISVKLFATLVQEIPESFLAHHPGEFRAGRPITIELPEGSSIADLLDHLALSAEKVKVVFVNGRKRELDYALQPGDEVGVFPPIGGG